MNGIQPPKPRILVFGTGGVGCIYAYLLQRGGAAVTTVCRSNFAAVSASGISIDSKLFGAVHFTPDLVVRTVDDAISSSTEPYDYVVVCSKAFPGTAALVHAAVTPAITALVLCQNGIGIEDEYAAAFPQNPILSGVVYLPTTQVSPGRVLMGPLQRLEIGPFPAGRNSGAAERFATVFRAGGGVIEVCDDVQAQRWIKLSVNVAWNPICALTRCDDANFIRSSPMAEGTVRDTMAEVAALAKKAGYDVVSQAAIDEQMGRPQERLETGGKEPSMLTDVRENRALEVEAILGNAVLIARKLDMETPRLDMLYTLAKALSFSITPDSTWKPIAS
jgi:2-dehydropantoate 2-reductase